MLSEQVGYEGNGKRRGEEVALDKADVHVKEEKMQDTHLYKGNHILRMTCNKILHDTDQKPKLEE